MKEKNIYNWGAHFFSLRFVMFSLPCNVSNDGIYSVTTLEFSICGVVAFSYFYENFLKNGSLHLVRLLVLTTDQLTVEVGNLYQMFLNVPKFQKKNRNHFLQLLRVSKTLTESVSRCGFFFSKKFFFAHNTGKMCRIQKSIPRTPEIILSFIIVIYVSNISNFFFDFCKFFDRT